MLTLKEIQHIFRGGEADNRMKEVYGCTDSQVQHYGERYVGVAEEFEKYFGTSDGLALFSAPGRTEIGGNHTDHQHGHVLAASVNLDVIAAAKKTDSNLIRIKSEGYNMDVICLDDMSIQANEINHSASLIRGVAKKFMDLGYPVGGFDAYTTSNVLKGSGLSSSAAFEILVGNIINTFFAEEKESAISIAQIGQYAENVYYGKPSGLMDQMASSFGGIIAIDFSDPTRPVVDPVSFDFNQVGYGLCIIDSGADHGDLTAEYSSIPAEMKAVAVALGKEFLSQVSPDSFYNNLAKIRAVAGDRAVLRAMHYFADDQRVSDQVAALRNDNFNRFLTLIKESGYSSFMYLQNVFAASMPQEQAVSIVLALCERLLKDCAGAWRVHGGGFAGTVQAFVPVEKIPEFKTEIESVFGQGKCHILNIRPTGGICILK